MVQERAQETRSRILKAAAEEFDERGYTGATIGRIGDRLGTSKGIINYHFKSKAILARELVEDAFGEDMFVGVEELPSDLQGMSFFVRSCYDVGEAFMYDVATRAAIRLQAEHKLIEMPLPLPYIDWMQLIAETLRQAQGLGEISEDVDVDATAWVLVASFAGLQTVSDRLTGRTDLHGHITTWLRLSMRSLGCTNAEEIITRELDRRAREAA